MRTLIAINKPEAAHLQAVIEEMRVLGSPTLRVVDCGDHYVALEGSHRIAAAEKLGLALDLDVLRQDEIVETQTLDWEWLEWDIKSAAAGELVEMIGMAQAVPYKIDEDGIPARCKGC